MSKFPTVSMFFALAGFGCCACFTFFTASCGDAADESSPLDATVSGAADSGAAPTSDAFDTELDDGNGMGAGRHRSASKCVSQLVILQTGKDPSCGGGNQHAWPVGMAAGDCHGWRAIDPAGKTHDNSAKAIGCKSDGTFTFTQYAGNLLCEGNGVVKTFTAGTCKQDIPPTLYTKAIDLSCCMEPTAKACKTGMPSVTVPGAQIYLNGVLCN